LEAAILNLAVNARDAMPGGGEIELQASNTGATAEANILAGSASRGGEFVVLTVRDAGCGMSEEVRARAVEPFFTTKGPGKGTGLGLSQVHGFIERTGGHMMIVSAPGQGTTVRLFLPRAMGLPPLSTGAPAACEMPTAIPGEKVVVVEDQEDVRQSTASAFRELGYEVYLAASAQEALQILKTRSDIALIFSDIVMAGMDGHELAQTAAEKYPRTRVMLTTGYDRSASGLAGQQDFPVVPKPFSVDELARRVRMLLDGGSTDPRSEGESQGGAN
jgi:CheY-like chemotaxis protein